MSYLAVDDVDARVAKAAAAGARLMRPIFDVPNVGRIAILTEPGGAKLAKSRRSLPLQDLKPGPALFSCLAWLGLEPPSELKAAPVSDMLHWSVQNWSPVRVPGGREIALAH